MNFINYIYIYFSLFYYSTESEKLVSNHTEKLVVDRGKLFLAQSQFEF